MIRANPGWVAYFKTDKGRAAKPVEAWDESGNPLVVSGDCGHLVLANIRPDFIGIYRREEGVCLAVLHHHHDGVEI